MFLDLLNGLCHIVRQVRVEIEMLLVAAPASREFEPGTVAPEFIEPAILEGRYAACDTVHVVALYRVSRSIARQIAGYVLRGLFCTLTDLRRRDENVLAVSDSR